MPACWFFTFSTQAYIKAIYLTSFLAFAKSYMRIQESHMNFTKTDTITKGFPLLSRGDI